MKTLKEEKFVIVDPSNLDTVFADYFDSESQMLTYDSREAAEEELSTLKQNSSDYGGLSEEENLKQRNRTARLVVKKISVVCTLTD